MPRTPQVFALDEKDAMSLEAVFKDWPHAVGDAAMPVNVRRQRVSLDACQQLAQCVVRDYNPEECEESLCKGWDDASSTSGMSNITIIQTDDELAQFQAVDTPGVTNPHERAHLIPKHIVRGGVPLLNTLTPKFWEDASRLYGVTKEQVSHVLKTRSDSLNNDPSNFVAVTRQFHNAFDGLTGQQYILGEKGGSKRLRISMGKTMVLLHPHTPSDGTAGPNDRPRCVLRIIPCVPIASSHSSIWALHS